VDRSSSLSAESLKDAAYVAVGFSVLGFQRAQVRRRELTRQLRKERPELWSQIDEACARMGGLVSDLGRQLRARIET
jgi:hypothetical protein